MPVFSEERKHWTRIDDATGYATSVADCVASQLQRGNVRQRCAPVNVCDRPARNGGRVNGSLRCGRIVL